MKAKAKLNIFLKILGFDERKYHLLSSRFILLDEPYDELYFTNSKQNEGFEILSDFQCENNIIKKAYNMLCLKGFKNKLEEFFKQKSLVLTKNIPLCSGLGGSSTDGATFLQLINEELNLKLDKHTLIKWGKELGSDVAFFLSGYESANISGCGEVVEEFDDEVPQCKLFTPDIFCQTGAVYAEFDLECKKVGFDLQKNIKEAKFYEKLSSKELLELKNSALNDLFNPCVKLYPKMREFLEQDFFLSGSGSTVFKEAL